MCLKHKQVLVSCTFISILMSNYEFHVYDSIGRTSFLLSQIPAGTTWWAMRSDGLDSKDQICMHSTPTSTLMSVTPQSPDEKSLVAWSKNQAS